MPEISRFFGIVIAIYWNDHGVPYFHAKYAGQRAKFSISDLRLLEGKLPARVTALVLEWAFQHREELMRDWELAAAKKPLQPIPPLEQDSSVMRWVTSVEYVSGYKLRLGFNNGSVKLVDLAEHLDGEVFEPLRDLRLFKTARLNPDLDTVVWDNGADMAPEFLYEIGVSEQEPAMVAETPAKYTVKPKSRTTKHLPAKAGTK